MALLIKTDDLKGLLSPNEIVAAVEEGYRKWAQEKAYPRGDWVYDVLTCANGL